MAKYRARHCAWSFLITSSLTTLLLTFWGRGTSNKMLTWRLKSNGPEESSFMLAQSTQLTPILARSTNTTSSKSLSQPTSHAVSVAQQASVADIVVVLQTYNGRLDVVKASRLWRKGRLPAIFVFQEGANLSPSDLADFAANNEHVLSYPKCDRWVNNFQFESPGNRAWAMAPFLAHRLLRGQYKWLAFGDDDTYFFTTGLTRLASKLDHRKRFWVSDAVCGPCGRTPPACAKLVCPLCTPNQTGGFCNGDCTPRQICEGAHPDNIQGCLDTGFPIAYGGTGMLLSVGLLQSLSMDAFENCTFTEPALSGYGGSDNLLAACLWRLGATLTVPEIDPLRPMHAGRFGNMLGKDLLRIGQEAVDGSVSQDNMRKLAHGVSTHLTVRGLEKIPRPVHKAGAGLHSAAIKALTAVYDFAIQGAGLD